MAIQKNATYRRQEKLFLNSFTSFWCKLTESTNRSKSKVISDLQELFRFLATTGTDLTNLLFANDEIVWVTWK